MSSRSSEQFRIAGAELRNGDGVPAGQRLGKPVSRGAATAPPENNIYEKSFLKGYSVWLPSTRE